MSISFFRGLELVVGALLLVVAVVAPPKLRIHRKTLTPPPKLVMLPLSIFNTSGASSAEDAAFPKKPKNHNQTRTPAVLPRTVYVYNGDVVCFADGLPWVVRLGRLEYLDIWMPAGPLSDVGGGAVAGCREAVVSGAVYVVKLVTARGAEASVVVTAN